MKDLIHNNLKQMNKKPNREELEAQAQNVQEEINQTLTELKETAKTRGSQLLIAGGGLAGGYGIARWGLRRLLWPMACCLNVPNLAYALLSWYPEVDKYWAYLAITAEQFGYGFGFAAYLVFMMRVSEGMARMQASGSALDLVAPADAQSRELTLLGVDDDDVAYFAEHVSERDDARTETPTTGRSAAPTLRRWLRCRRATR